MEGLYRLAVVEAFFAVGLLVPPSGPSGEDTDLAQQQIGTQFPTGDKAQPNWRLLTLCIKILSLGVLLAEVLSVLLFHIPVVTFAFIPVI